MERRYTGIDLCVYNVLFMLPLDQNNVYNISKSIYIKDVTFCRTPTLTRIDNGIGRKAA